MTPQQLIGIGVRLFAIWLAMTSLFYLLALPGQLARADLDDSQFISYAIGAGYLIATVVLWCFPMSIAHKLLPRTKYDNTLSMIQPLELARVGAALVGLCLLAKALPSVVDVIFRAFLFVPTGSTFAGMDLDTKLNLAGAVFELLLSVAIIVKARTFAIYVFSEPGAPSPDDSQ